MRALLTFLGGRQAASRSPPPPLQGSGSRFNVIRADELLGATDLKPLTHRIDEITNLPQQYRDRYIHPALSAFAEFVQQLPASEAHHHAEPGGMLAHALDVTTMALLVRRGHILPQGAEPEAVSKLADLWTYAVFTAALLHDIGKPVVDQEVRLQNATGQDLGRWDPWRGPMTTVPDARSYTFRFARDRQHKLHERAAPILAHRIIPPEGLSWLACNRDVFACWSATIMGDMDHAGILGQIINQADRESVAQNLGAGERVNLAPRVKPLHEKLIVALRHLLDQGELPLNRNGAAGWLTGDDLWMVSKRIADALRGHLQAEGHTGIPSSNDRVFDTLQENGLLVPNGDRAIWKAEIAGDGWSNTLTLLRIRADRVWPDPTSRPEAFGGQVTPEADTPAESDGSDAIAPSNGAESDVVTNALEQESVEPDDSAPAPAPVSTRSPVDSQDRTLGVTKLPTNALPQTDSPSESSTDDASASDAGSAFIRWLQKAVQSGDFPLNTAHARVHTVPEGVLVVSPGVFRDFARDHPEHGDWSHIQKRFQKLKLHEKTPGGTNIHTYRVAGERQSSTIKGILIRDVNLLFGGTPPPAPNPHLAHLPTPT